MKFAYGLWRADEIPPQTQQRPNYEKYSEVTPIEAE